MKQRKAINLVELLVSEEEQHPSPCKHGNVVSGHACYCHHPDAVGKCHIFRFYGLTTKHWNNKNCKYFIRI